MTNSEEKIDKYGYCLAIGVMAQAVLLFSQEPEKPAAVINRNFKRWQTNLLFEKRVKKRPRHKPGTP